MTVKELRTELRKLNTRYELNDDYLQMTFIYDSEEIIKSFLKQIRNEIYEDYDETQSIYSVQKVFNKYLKEN